MMNESLTNVVYITWKDVGNNSFEVIRDYLIKIANEKELKLYDRDELGIPIVYMKRLFEGNLCFCIYGSKTNLIDFYV
jgi:hypothetical protein